MARHDNDWCILRTAGRSTLPLAKSLSDAGYDVWAPSQVPDGPAKRRHAERVPMTPTYLFARALHVLKLIALSANPGRSHEGFSVFRNCHGVPLIADSGLNPLRAEEANVERRWQAQVQRGRSRRKGQAFEVGETVSVPAEAFPSFAGMNGMVDESGQRHTYVSLGGFMRLKISTYILRQSMVGNDHSPDLGAAA